MNSIKIKAEFCMLLIFALIFLPVSTGNFSNLTPQDDAVTSQAVEFRFSVSEDMDNCSLMVDASPEQNYPNITSGRVFNFTFSPDEGEHEWQVVCFKNSSEHSSELRDFIYDVSAPDISLVTPVNGSTVDDNDVNITVETDEKADCSLDTANVSISSMDFTFKGSGNKKSVILKEVSDGSKVFYIRCRDNAENEASMKINFLVDVPVKAKIEIDTNVDDEDHYFLPAGRKKLEVTLSKSVDSIPTLYYQYDENKNYVPLTGSGRRYTGYIIQNSKADDRVGVFYIVAENENIEITDGQMFIVDAKNPSTPNNARAQYYDGKVFLEWYYKGEDIDYFKIYRANADKVEFLDFISRSGDTGYFDSSVEPGKTYFYKISAVDLAGNEGEFSPAAKIVIPTAQQAAMPIPKESLDKLNSSDALLKRLQLELEASLEILEASGDIKALGMIKEYRYADVINDKLKKLKTLQDSLSGSASLSSSEVTKLISDIQQFDKETRTVAVKDVNFEGQSSDIQTTDDSLISQILKEYLAIKGQELTKEQEALAIERVKNINNNIRISNTASAFTITRLDGKKDSVTLIEKEISNSGEESLSNVIAVEYISKTAVSSSDDIRFLSSNYDILKNDPVIGFNFEAMGIDANTIKYYVKGLLADTKGIKTIIIPNDIAVFYESPTLTGFSVAKTAVGRIIKDNQVLGILVIALVSLYLYYQVAVKRNFPINRFPSRKKPNAREKRDIGNFRFIMQQAHREIDNLNYEASKSIYASLISLMKSEIKSSFLARQEKEALALLYKKLYLYHKISYAYSLYQRKEMEKLKSELSGIRHDVFDFRLRQKEETDFSSYINHWYFHLQNMVDYYNR